MNENAKKTLLLRKFSSLDYMKEMLDYFDQSIEGLANAIDYYKSNCSHIDTSKWSPAETVEAWEQRAVPNFNMIKKSIVEAIRQYQSGDNRRLLGTTNSIMSLSKDMDVLGDKWWRCLPQNVAHKYGVPLGKAKKCASNIWRTVGDYWDPGDILDEFVTGPIDEQELLKYLKPGESLEDIS